MADQLYRNVSGEFVPVLPKGPLATYTTTGDVVPDGLTVCIDERTGTIASVLNVDSKGRPTTGFLATLEENVLPDSTWAWCDGSTISIDGNPEIYRYYGDRFNDGTEPAGTFRLPLYATLEDDGTTTYKAVKLRPSEPEPVDESEGIPDYANGTTIDEVEVGKESFNTTYSMTAPADGFLVGDFVLSGVIPPTFGDQIVISSGGRTLYCRQLSYNDNVAGVFVREGADIVFKVTEYEGTRAVFTLYPTTSYRS